MQAHGEVGGEEGPDLGAAQPLGALAEVSRDAGAGEQDVEEVGEEDGPEEGDGAEQEEEGEEAGDGEGVEQDEEGLEAALEGHVEGGPADGAAAPSCAGATAGDEVAVPVAVAVAAVEVGLWFGCGGFVFALGEGGVVAVSRSERGEVLAGFVVDVFVDDGAVAVRAVHRGFDDGLSGGEYRGVGGEDVGVGGFRRDSTMPFPYCRTARSLVFAYAGDVAASVDVGVAIRVRRRQAVLHRLSVTLPTVLLLQPALRMPQRRTHAQWRQIFSVDLIHHFAQRPGLAVFARMLRARRALFDRVFVDESFLVVVEQRVCVGFRAEVVVFPFDRLCGFRVQECHCGGRCLRRDALLGAVRLEIAQMAECHLAGALLSDRRSIIGLDMYVSSGKGGCGNACGRKSNSWNPRALSYYSPDADDDTKKLCRGNCCTPQASQTREPRRSTLTVIPPHATLSCRTMAMAIDNPPPSSTLLSQPTDETAHPLLNRTASAYNPLPTFHLPKGENRHYQQQYADMYFARLAQLKPAVEHIAADAWSELEIAGETPRRVDRVLDVRQGDLCWVIGTCYMEMPLKPNVLEDIGKEHWIAAPPPRAKYTDEGEGQVMLEDESGRLSLTGGVLGEMLLVTGAIVAVVGTENKDGEFEVLDLRVPDLPRQPARWERDDGEAAVKGKKVSSQRPKGGKVAIVSGLSISGDEGDTLTLDLLMEYLLGELTGPDDQEATSTISRLIIAGNSISHGSPIPSRADLITAASRTKTARRYGYDSASYNPAPTDRFDTFLSTLLPSIPITLLPGESDPTSTSLPQQPIHPAIFPHSRAYMQPPGAVNPTDTETETETETSWFHSTTNPAEFDLDGLRFLVAGGQTVNDVYKYISSHTSSRLETMESMLRWRLSAPTAPDTLWCYPFQDGDAFVVKECPHVYVVGDQPRFETGWVEGPQGQGVRLVAVPAFRETGEVVLVDLEDGLGVELVRIGVFEGG